MKKMFKLVLFVLLLGLFVNACSPKEEQKHEETKTNKTPEEKEVMPIKMSELVPDPQKYFLNSDKYEVITNDDGYYVYMDNVTEDEWNKYIEECKKDGYWANDEYQSNYSWYVYSSDNKYELLIDRYGEQNDYLSIIVKENNKE